MLLKQCTICFDIVFSSQSHDELLTTPRVSRRQTVGADAVTASILNQMRLSLSTSMSRLAVASEPLASPSLVLAAISKASGLDGAADLSVSVSSAANADGAPLLDTSLVWAALNAASASSNVAKASKASKAKATVKATTNKKKESTDVSVTVTGSGNGTMLTIATNLASGSASEAKRTLRTSQPRLGTSGLGLMKTSTSGR